MPAVLFAGQPGAKQGLGGITDLNVQSTPSLTVSEVPSCKFTDSNRKSSSDFDLPYEQMEGRMGFY